MFSNRLINIIVFILLVSPIIILFSFWHKPTQGKRISIETNIIVHEGTVDLFRFDAKGKPVFLRVVRQGETAQVAVADREYGDGDVLNFLLPVFTKGLEAILGYAESLAGEKTQTQFVRLFEEKDLNGFIQKSLRGVSYISDARAEIHRDSFNFYGRLKRGILNTEIHVKGVVAVDSSGKLYLRLKDVQWGVFHLPEFMLKRLEDVFYSSIRENVRRLQVLNVEYREGGILLTGRLGGGLAGIPSSE